VDPVAAAVIQGGLPFEADPAVVLRARPDGSIEARWPDDLCMVYQGWPMMLERLPAVCAFLHVPYVLRVRR
jgi:hypothetical protein